MKKIINLMLIILICCITANSQTVIKQDANGNFITVKDTTKIKIQDKLSGKTFTDTKGNVYPIYISSRGSMYVIRTSAKSGKQYRQYLKLE